jgi:hypothetical protein
MNSSSQAKIIEKGIIMTNIQIIEKNDSQVIITHFSNITDSEVYLKNLRAQNDHTPVIVMANRGDIIPEMILSNCCGGHLFRDEVEKLPEMIELMLKRNHEIHC